MSVVRGRLGAGDGQPALWVLAVEALLGVIATAALVALVLGAVAYVATSALLRMLT